jgi:adenine-specific DNA methylase
VPWEATGNETLLNAARYEIARSVARSRGETLPPFDAMKPRKIIDYLQANAPPVYDPFSGGGSIPLEAQRLGLRAMGSDLNPVAVLIGKALVEFPPKFAGRKPINPEADELRHWSGAEGLAEDVRYYGRWMREEAEKERQGGDGHRLAVGAHRAEPRPACEGRTCAVGVIFCIVGEGGQRSDRAARRQSDRDGMAVRGR